MKKQYNFFFTVAMILITSVAFSQGTVTGKVVDENGPLPGASVVVKGTTNGTSADFDGNFNISLPNNSSRILVFSYLGYKTEEIKIENDKESYILEFNK